MSTKEQIIDRALIDASGGLDAQLKARLEDEIDRLMEAKRHFSALADAKGKENCALRQENERLMALTTRLRTAAESVCWFDWSNNDRDAVEAITELRLALEQEARPEDFASDNGFC